MERVSGRYEDKKGENEALKQRVAALEGEVRNAQRRMEMVKATSSCSQPAKKMTDEMKNLDLQYNGIMIEKLLFVCTSFLNRVWNSGVMIRTV